MKDLTPERARIFRIVHRDNVPWILDRGLHCHSSNILDPNYIEIGNPELILKRKDRPIPVPPKGTLSDYVPFYFTPCSPMLYNIRTGYNGITKRSNDEIVIFISSLRRLHSDGIPFIFTDRHAYLAAAQFSSSLSDLDRIDWHHLQNRDFKKDHENPDKFERYQAEALVHKHLPLASLLGIVCHSELIDAHLKKAIAARGLNLPTAHKSNWYFR